MIYSDTVLYQGIVQDIDYLLFGSSTATSPYAIADKTRNVNRRFDDVVSAILQSDARWKWDDDNQSDQPIGTINLVDQQAEYEIAGGTYLKIQRVEVLDSSGNYQLVKPIDEKDVQNQSLTEFQKTAGMPRFYDKNGEYIWLYPKPSSSQVTTSAGLKVYYQRSPSYFVAGDTTKVPGFAAPYHRILSIGAALDYAIANEMTGKINILTPMLLKLEADLKNHYANRAGDVKVSLRVAKDNYGAGDYQLRGDRTVY